MTPTQPTPVNAVPAGVTAEGLRDAAATCETEARIHEAQDKFPGVAEHIRLAAQACERWAAQIEAEATPKCERCQQNASRAPHECPYASEINDDHKTCTCCEDCQGLCSDEI